VVLLNLLPDLPERQGGFFELDTRLVVTRIVYRLIRSLGDATLVEAAVRQILPEVKTLSSKFELIKDVGYQEGAGHKLVSETAAAEFERAWREEVRMATAADLTRETNLLRVLLLVKRAADSSEIPLKIDDLPELTQALLRSARSEVKGQTEGNRAIYRSPRLAWAALIELFGDEAILKERIDKLKATNPEGVKDLLELTDRYLSGWRPNDFGDDN
jgi:hypothetical protein